MNRPTAITDCRFANCDILDDRIPQSTQLTRVTDQPFSGDISLNDRCRKENSLLLRIVPCKLQDQVANRIRHFVDCFLIPIVKVS
jgi:hypothetical protein